VKCFKIGTREMNKYAKDIRTIRGERAGEDHPHLPRRVPFGFHGAGRGRALVGFASFIPDMIVDLYDAVCAGDLKKAMDLQFRINP